MYLNYRFGVKGKTFWVWGLFGGVFCLLWFFFFLNFLNLIATTYANSVRVFHGHLPFIRTV